MAWNASRNAAPAVLLAALVLLPFHDKAFTVDDTLFLLQAEHALVDPLHPAAFEVSWNEHVPERLSTVMPSGPVMAWLLVPAVLAGGAEWVAHVLQLLMLIVAIVATASLAIRIGLPPASAAVAGLLLAATPAVLAMASTAMPDVAAMALGVAGVERLVAWKQNRRFHEAATATLLLGMAPLARTHLVLVTGIAALFLARDIVPCTRPARWTTWLPLAAAPLVTWAVASITRDPAADSGHIVWAASALSALDRMAPNSVSFALHWVVALPLALPWLLLRRAETRMRWSVLLGFACGAAGLLAYWHGVRAPYAIALIAAVGATALMEIVADGWKRNDQLQLILAAWLFVAFPTAIYTHLPPKFLIASAPAAALLVAKLAVRSRLARPVIGLTVALGLLLGLAIVRADARFANLGRTAAAALIAPQVVSGRRVWYAGHWGFQWYAEKAGARCLTTRPPYPRHGDLVVASLNSESRGLVEMIPPQVRRHVGAVQDATPGGRVMSREAGAGFYSNWWGYLPWAWGDDVIDRFDVWRIDTRAASLVR